MIMIIINTGNTGLISGGGHSHVLRAEKEKVEKYQDLKIEIRRLWKLRNEEIVPVVIGALGSVSV